MLTYAADHDDKLPPSYAWMDAISPIVVPDKAIPILRRRENGDFRCPSVRRRQFGYAMNRTLSGRADSSVSDPDRVPLTFDSTQLGPNADAWPPDAPLGGRHGNRNNFSFLDGHVNSFVVGSEPWRSAIAKKNKSKSLTRGTNHAEPRSKSPGRAFDYHGNDRERVILGFYQDPGSF
jgi:prepilin-type processing-associated H-X9-DG protein